MLIIKNILIGYILTETDNDPFKMWPKGAIILVALLALIVLIGLAVFLGYRTIKERERYLEEKSSYMEGVLSKSEIKANINLLISKSTSDTPFSLVYIDIDEVTQMTNAFGEKAVKTIIETIAQKILKILPFQVQMGRLGIDKFLILFRTEYSHEEVFRIADQIKDVIKEPVRISYDTETTATASIGIAYFPTHGQTYNQLLNSLEIAVITVKRNGGDHIVAYSEDLGGEEGQNKLYYEQIKTAIINKEFVLFYQPIINTEHNSFISAEALLRWNHPKRGILNPKEFINVMEQSGDIYWVGIWGLELMIEQYNVLRRIMSNGDFTLSINLSVKQLMNDRLALDFQKLIKKYKFPAKNLVIEADEFIIYNKHETINENIKKIRELGFKIAVDGFAFDYNTLLKLNTLQIDVIKLDAGFVDEDNKEILKNFIQLLLNYAKKNNVEIIVEKIENREQIEYFESQGIYNFQGYFISKPISSEDLQALAANADFLEALAEKKNIEETKTEETPAEEEQSEESTSDDQPIVEEEQPEEPVTEETPAEESNTEEQSQSAEQEVEDTPVEETPVEDVQPEEPVIDEQNNEDQPAETSSEEDKKEETEGENNPENESLEAQK